MNPPLDSAEIRVLGSLIEKEITTPEYYPLTLNALVNACNQKSNRDPVVQYEDDDVAETIYRLRHRGLMSVLKGGSNRVPKYGHRVTEVLNLGRREMALLCELMVRGPQTPGELRDRAGRMHRFSDLDEVENCLRSLPALVKQLDRQPGRKEARYAHLLAGEPEAGVSAIDVGGPAARGRMETLEQEVADLRERVAKMEAEWEKFRQDFS